MIGFVLVANKEMEAARADYLERRQTAVDHGLNGSFVKLDPLPERVEVKLPSIAYWIALSCDELHVAVAYGESLALFEVAEIYRSVSTALAPRIAPCCTVILRCNMNLLVLSQTSPSPYYVFESISAYEVAWCPLPGSQEFVVVTQEKKWILCDTDGSQRSVDSAGSACSGMCVFVLLFD